MLVTDFTPPEDGEPTTFRERAKGWAEKHPTTIRVIKAVGAGTVIAVGVVAAVVALKPDGTAEDEDDLAGRSEDSTNAKEVEGVADQEQPSASGRTSASRDSARNHVRNLHPGWNASEEKKAQYKEETGEDLPPGTTWVSPKSDADDSPDGEDSRADDSSEDEDPGEAAA